MSDSDEDWTIAEMIIRKRGKKMIPKRKKISQKSKKQLIAADVESLPNSAEGLDGVPDISLFDDNVDNHFKAINKISDLCGEEAGAYISNEETERMSSSVTFLREWRHFKYQERVVRFACQSESPLQGKDDAITLPQFSAASVPKRDRPSGKAISAQSSNDFVMYAGGLVWALDWCPRVAQRPDCKIKCEFIAVAAHAPDSSYHQIGAPLTGRGLIQIWCHLHVEDCEPQIKRKLQKNPINITAEGNAQPKKPRGRPRTQTVDKANSQVKRARGRPRKEVNESSMNPQALAGEKAKSPQAKGERGRPRKKPRNDPSKEIMDPQTLAVEEPLSPLAKKGRRRPPTKRTNGAINAVEFSESSPMSTEIVSVDTCVEKPKSPEAKRRRGRRKMQQRNEAMNAVEYPESSPISTEIVSVDACVEKPKSPEAKRGRGRRKMEQRNEAMNAVQYPERSPMSTEIVSVDACVEKPKSPEANRGRGRRKMEQRNGAMNAVEYPERSPMSTEIVSVDTSHNVHNVVEEDSVMKKKGFGTEVLSDIPLLTSGGKRESSPPYLIPPFKSGQEPKDGPAQSFATSCGIPGDVALPRLVLGLAHNGKVTWDVKWRPSNNSDNKSRHRMGYLAVLLGSGALEVWEVFLPQTMKVLYSACQKEGADPRFVKLEPVFRCSKIMRGGMQSIPLTVEWSTSAPHDRILAGCHDGTVAVWKFSAQVSCADTRPLFCFSADRVPIRSLAWAPSGSDCKSPDIIVTAGHRGLKFWDLRDTFCPLWDFNPVQRNILSLDWVPDPRCIILSLDDGTLRFFCLENGANNVPITGQPLVATSQQGFYSYYCSSYAIWSVHVSRSTGMVAYCGADGNALRFQLTGKAVGKDPRRNRAPHFLCGSFTEEDSILTVVTPLPDTPFPMMKSLKEWSDTPRSKRGFLSVFNQAQRAKENAKSQVDDNEDEPEFEAEIEATPGKRKENGDVGGSEVEVMPAKNVAMNRVRWNVNKGGQRWLCYGGAAGIVRCQEVDYAFL